MPQAGDAIGRFVLQRELGRGPLSEVFLAEDASRWRVALKVFLLEPGSRPDDQRAWSARMIREARAAAAFRHDCVVDVHEIGQIGDQPYLVRDFIEGRSLADVAGDPAEPLERKLHWLREFARTLADIHRAGLVHRDVKPSNALVRRDGALRVLDFGVARRSIDRSAGIAPPSPDRIPGMPRPRVLGTPAYTAPERFAHKPSSPYTDQFGWGVVAFEVLSGALPWVAHEGPIKMIEAILTAPPAPLDAHGVHTAAIPPAIGRVVARAMAKTAIERFPSMDDVVRAFDAAARDGSP